MHVAILVVDRTFDSGLSAVTDVLETANALREQIDQPPQPLTVTTLGLRRHVRTGAGHVVTATTRGQLTTPLDLLVMPALGVKEPQALVEAVRSDQYRSALGLIADARRDGVELAAACTGTFFLAEAGVLGGLAATTSWWLGPVFRQRYPTVALDETRTLVRDARIVTAGAAFAAEP
jgi:transcriptional regulator GlxA family with amidase domain